MSTIRIIPRNFHDDATLSTEIAPVTGHSITNTQNAQRSRVWRSTNGADQYVQGFYADGLPRTVDFFGMFRHRCHGGSIRSRFYSDASWTTLVHDTGVNPIINVTPTDGLDWGVNQYGTGSTDPLITETPYWTWDIPAIEHLSFRHYFTSNVATYDAAYWQVCRFFLGLAYRLPYNILYDNALTVVDQTDSNRSRGGSKRTNVGPNWKEFNADVKRLPEADRAGWIDIRKRVGRGRDFVLSVFPEDGTRKERDHIINCEFKTLDPFVRWLRGYLSTRIQVEEV